MTLHIKRRCISENTMNRILNNLIFESCSTDDINHRTISIITCRVPSSRPVFNVNRIHTLKFCRKKKMFEVNYLSSEFCTINDHIYWISVHANKSRASKSETKRTIVIYLLHLLPLTVTTNSHTLEFPLKSWAL